MKVRSATLINIIQAFLFITIMATPLFYFKRGIYPFGLPKILLFQILTEISFIFWMALLLFYKDYRPRWTPLKIALGGFVIMLIITATTGVDVWKSFWSTGERGLGIIALLHLSIFTFLIASLFSKINWRRLLDVSLITGVIVDGIAILQLYLPELLGSGGVGNRPGSTFGNPTFLAGYALLHFFLAIYLFFDRNPIQRTKAWILGKTIFYSFAIILNLITVFIAQTRGDILGLGAGIFFLLMLWTIQPPFQIKVFSSRLLFGLLLASIIVGGGIFWTTRTSSLWQRVPGLSRFQDLSISSQSLQPRIITLKMGLRGFLERPFLGWGAENFTAVFDKYYNPQLLRLGRSETRFDKAHNVIVEYLVAGGLLLMLAVIALFTTFFYEAWQLRNRLGSQIITAGIIAVIIRGLFFFDTIGVLLLFYLIFAIVDGQYASQWHHPHQTFETNYSPVKITGILFLGGAILMAGFLINVQPLRAFNNQFWGINYFLNGKNKAALEYFHRGISIVQPYQWIVKKDYAVAIIGAYVRYPDVISPEEAMRALRVMEVVVEQHPSELAYHTQLLDLYNKTFNFNPTAIGPKAEQEIKTALTLSPRRQSIYFLWAKLKTLQNDYGEALQILNKALAFDKEVPESNFYYGLVAFAKGKQENNAELKKTGYEKLKKAIEGGYVWQDGNELRVIGNFFLDFGHYEEAIMLYKKSLELQNSNEVKLKLGIAYFLNNQKEEAKSIIAEVAVKNDLTASSAYPELIPIIREFGIEL